jgi:hypothetical protein
MTCSKCKTEIKGNVLHTNCPCCWGGILKVCEDCFNFIEFGDNPLTMKDITD